jgi:hypothetical protein
LGRFHTKNGRTVIPYAKIYTKIYDLVPKTDSFQKFLIKIPQIKSEKEQTTKFIKQKVSLKYITTSL